MVTILDGKNLAKKITEDIKKQVENLGKKPKLAVILVGNNPASEIYVRNKQKKALELGFESIVLPLPADISEENLLEHIYILNEDTSINAILVQLPLPAHINKQRILEAIEPIKDVDGFTSYNFGRLALGYKPYSVPCTPKGIIRILDLKKRNAASPSPPLTWNTKPKSATMLTWTAPVTLTTSRT